MTIFKRTIKVEWGNFDVSNELWTCPCCGIETNSVKWHIEISWHSKTYTCPICGIEQGEGE